MRITATCTDFAVLCSENSVPYKVVDAWCKRGEQL